MQPIEFEQSNRNLLKPEGMTDEQYEAELKRIQDRLKLILQDATPDSTEMKPAVSHNTEGRIRVKDKVTGKTGTISEGAFNPQKYDKV
mgnify:CR=1 FL=1